MPFKDSGHWLYHRSCRVIVVLFLLAPSLLYAQSRQIQGIVTDDTNASIPNATVVNKTTGVGTATNKEGRFKITAAAGEELEISAISYETSTVRVGSQTSVTVKLATSSASLADVVVVGYGTQKKVNLTGSVTAISMSDVTKGRPVTNLSRGLSGLAAGVYVNSSANRPGGDNASITVRGQGTLNNSAPFVVIDGVEGNISSVNPEDIETVSILKDAASSAIYGSRAANGVILITTKKGKSGKVKFSYNGFLSSESVANTIEPVSNYADYMALVNEGFTNAGQAAPFKQATIDLWRQNEGKDPLKYPNSDWRDAVFRTANATTHNISASGGSEKTTFFSSFRYSNNPGVIENAGVKRYDLRTNIDAKIKDWFTLGTNLNGSVADLGLGSQQLNSVFTFSAASTPGMVFRAPDGRYGGPNNLEDDPQSNNTLYNLNNINGNDRFYNFMSRFYTVIKPFPGFTINGSYTYKYASERRWDKPVFIDKWNFLTNTISTIGGGQSSIYNYSTRDEHNFMDISGTYEKRMLDRLNLKAMIGASQEQYQGENTGVRRMDLIDPTLEVIDGAIGLSSASGSKYQWVMRSYFGRLNLNWDEKYLAEFNLRADASSRFLSERRWGYFPSASVGWNIDKEAFMAGIIDKDVLSKIKLRGSYGSLGNNVLNTTDNFLNNYSAIPVYSLSNYVLNGAVQQGLSMRSIANSLLTWEKTYVANAGLDMSFFKNKLSATFEVFNKRTVDILIDLPAPLVHGTASIPKQNSATVVNKGIELALDWKDRVGELGYFVRGNFSYIKNNVTKYKGSQRTIDGANMLMEGYPIWVQYLRVVDRMIQTDADLALVQEIKNNAPVDPATGQKKNPFAYGEPGKGDLLYKDLNGDGLINDDDRTTFGHGTNPKYLYGLSFGADYKGFDFSALIQGVGGLKVFYNDLYYNSYVRWGYQINKEIADGRWYDGRTTPAQYPRLLHYGTTKNSLPSDFWLVNKAYLKIRNIQLGYTVPKKLISKAGLDVLRAYASLENFFTFTSYPGIDPEVSGVNYPSMKQIVVGLNLTF